MQRREGLVHTPQQLAYLGDAVWSLHVRCKYLSPPKNLAAYRTAAERHVNAARQSYYLDRLLAGGWRLSPEEARLVQWAKREMRDPRFRPKYSAAGGQLGTYRKATAFEAVVGGEGWGESKGCRPVAGRTVRARDVSSFPPIPCSEACVAPDGLVRTGFKVFSS
ncbi:hypothetical protein VaNZ11_014238 [Volvox africanus]|uniref:RNase III domain-containing protein n=1 Tax=Volvox africanus TaxID=51714 RepID=A0ABQ5SI65_9CHLO|nr:hypothetical protein VaNZ11_014238 [Volvox africanus]